VPDFIVRLKTSPVVHLILETKGFDDLAEVKAGAARRWVAAVNADGQFGRWQYEMARAMPRVRALLDQFDAA
jgi:type III restriction enzyme